MTDYAEKLLYLMTFDSLPLLWFSFFFFIIIISIPFICFILILFCAKKNCTLSVALNVHDMSHFQSNAINMIIRLYISYMNRYCVFRFVFFCFSRVLLLLLLWLFVTSFVQFGHFLGQSNVCLYGAANKIFPIKLWAFT